jgi:quinol monooxygenase YgiN
MIVVAKLKVKAGTEADAEKAFLRQIDYVRREEPDTLVYVLHRSRKDPTVFLFYERYASPEAFDRHGKSAALQELFAKLQPILDGPPSIEFYDEVAGKT